MKKTAIILATFAMGVTSAIAGPPPPAPVDKGPVPGPAPMDPCATPISYNNIEALYASTDWGGFEDSADGGILRAEYSPWQNIYIAGGVEYSDVEFGDLWIFNIGLGGYFPLTPNIHIAADGGYVYADFELDDDEFGGDDSDSEDGWYVRPHIRAKWRCLTAHAGALYRDLNDDDDGSSENGDDGDSGDWAWFVQLYYQIHPNWDITAAYMDGDEDFDQWSAGVRFKF
jgi:hypothetical protein